MNFFFYINTIGVFIVYVMMNITGECLSPDLDNLQKEYGEWRLLRSPVYSTSIGVYKYNDRVEQFAYAGFDEERVIS